MSDRLKLSDAKGDAAVEEIAHKSFIDDAVKRIQELESSNAALEKVLAAQKTLTKPAAAGNNKIGARKNASFKAVSTAPSINKTPRGSVMVPVAYPTVQDLSSSAGVASNVRFNGDPVYLLDSSSQPRCKGDEQGTGGGIRSGTVNGQVKPVKGSSSVRVNGKPVVRQGDACTMNGGNNPGIYITTQAPSAAPPSGAIATSNPAVTLETPEEESAFKKWLAESWEEMKQAYHHPIEGGKGAAKGIGNIPSDIGELLRAGSAEQFAMRMDETAQMLNALGMDKAAKTPSDFAKEARENAANLGFPKFTMNNPAQVGGNKILIAVQIFSAGIGIFKGASRWLKIHKGGVDNSNAVRASAKTIPRPLERKNIEDGVKVASRDFKKTISGRQEKIDALRNSHQKEIDDVSTFQPLGVNQMDIDVYLESENGIKFLNELRKADPTSDASEIYRRASQQLASGSNLPVVEHMNSPLIKIVPHGQTVSPYSPFFMKSTELDAAAQSGKTFAEYFGLPVKSESNVYDIYQITPKYPTDVFVSKIAPTTELGGAIENSAGGTQYIVPDRKAWTKPEFIKIIED
ncbi:DUF4150 domain-containing protein [Oxalobacteraceae bacterium]|nr:DUF4150 domain-containing protein [Oxalobacteraceae bacterium]